MDMLLWTVAGMAVVTYTSRLLPLVFLSHHKLPPFWNTFLGFIPFAALAAMIFPAVFTSTSHLPSAIVGAMVAVVCALCRLSVILVVFGGIGGAFLCELWIIGIK